MKKKQPAKVITNKLMELNQCWKNFLKNISKASHIFILT
jgi:hypothetical protein